MEATQGGLTRTSQEPRGLFLVGWFGSCCGTCWAYAQRRHLCCQPLEGGEKAPRPLLG